MTLTLWAEERVTLPPPSFSCLSLTNAVLFKSEEECQFKIGIRKLFMRSKESNIIGFKELLYTRASSFNPAQTGSHAKPQTVVNLYTQKGQKLEQGFFHPRPLAQPRSPFTPEGSMSPTESTKGKNNWMVDQDTVPRPGGQHNQEAGPHMCSILTSVQ